MEGVEIRGVTRSTFILRGAVAVGAAYGAAAVTPFVSNAFAATATEDVEVLQFALGLERLEAGFYKAALAQAGLTGRIQEIATEFGKHEAEHADALTKLITALGGKPDPAAAVKFKVGDEDAFLKQAVALEEIGISAYNGAAPAIQSADVLEAAGGIVNVEARHASALRMLADEDPAPVAFDKALSPDEVAAKVKQFQQG